MEPTHGLPRFRPRSRCAPAVLETNPETSSTLGQTTQTPKPRRQSRFKKDLDPVTSVSPPREFMEKGAPSSLDGAPTACPPESDIVRRLSSKRRRGSSYTDDGEPEGSSRQNGGRTPMVEGRKNGSKRRKARSKLRREPEKALESRGTSSPEDHEGAKAGSRSIMKIG
ncbi:hypothetical protein DL769_005802 [Monosporascus sp. CRB-8-3]|nr:hypothetical protein DL769_005802 [Monosporascus sp. CRB-8-3]